MKTILLKFGGPMQAWGTGSYFETRKTDLYPSKSAVIGLLAAAYGYRRHEEGHIQRLNRLNFAVRIDQHGRLLRDYHIAEKYDKKGEFERTYVTNRYYLEDAVFVVALGHEDDAWIDEISQVLARPYFQPFMGRRSLPIPANFLIGVEEGGPIECLTKLEWQAGEWFKRERRDQRSLTVIADSNLLARGNRTMRKDRVVSFDQKNRHFLYRYESKLEIPNPSQIEQTDHDAFGAIGGV